MVSRGAARKVTSIPRAGKFSYPPKKLAFDPSSFCPSGGSYRSRIFLNPWGCWLNGVGSPHLGDGSCRFGPQFGPSRLSRSSAARKGWSDFRSKWSQFEGSHLALLLRRENWGLSGSQIGSMVAGHSISQSTGKFRPPVSSFDHAFVFPG